MVVRLGAAKGVADFVELLMGPALMEDCWEHLDPGRLLQSVRIALLRDSGRLAMEVLWMTFSLEEE